MALWLAVACGLLGMAVCWFGREIMLLAGQEPRIAGLSGRFLQVIMWAMVPMIAANVLRSVVSALGRPIFATAITALAIGVSALANYAFVFGRLGAPALGLEGSALASVLTALFSLLAYVVAIGSDRRLRRYRLFGNWWRSEWQHLAELVRTGVPVALTILAEAGLFSGAAFLMGLIGASQLAGHAIALQVAALAFQVPFGVGQAATIRVGYHYGARDNVAVGRAGWVAIACGTGFMALTALIMLFAPRLVLGIYVDTEAARNAALMGFAVQFMMVAAAFQLFDGLQAVAAGALRGLQDTRVPMLYALFGYWVPGSAPRSALASSPRSRDLACGSASPWAWSSSRCSWSSAGPAAPVSDCSRPDDFLAERQLTASFSRPICPPLALSTRECQSRSSTPMEEVITMAFRPLHDRVLVRRIEAEEKTAGGIIIPDSAKEKPSEGEIVAVGSGVRAEDGKVTPLDVKAGDRVLFGKWSGTEVKLDGEDLLIMKESDIMGIIG